MKKPTQADEIDYTYAVDWDSDGDVDMLVHKKNGDLLWLERVEGGGLLEHPLRGAGMLEIRCLQALDVDSDRRLDVLLCNSIGDMLLYKVTEPGQLLLQTGDSNPFHSVKLKLNCATYLYAEQAAYANDLNSDGFVDVLECGCKESCPPDAGECNRRNNTLITLHFGNAQGFASRSIPSVTHGGTGICQAIDLDFDGTLDILVGWDTSWSGGGGLNATLQALELGPEISWRSIPLSLPEKHCYHLQFVDWDHDGQLDIVVKGSASLGEELFLYTRGFCEMPAACNAAGRCTPDGSCDCLASRSGFDCSSCAAGYWGRNAVLYSEECFPCPGVGSSSGMCWGRGVCNDDSRAQALAQGDGVSQVSILTARGDGNCSCSEWFGGVDVMGRMTCAEGECPKGFELRPDIATGSKACRLCLPGYGKAFTGNNECTPCVDNTYAGSEDGGICRSCSVGYVADRNRVSCSLDTSFVLLASGLFLIVSCWALMLPALLGFRLFIEDISHQAGKGVVITTTSKHFLLSRCGWMEVRFSDTGVPWLDVKDAENPASHAYSVLPISHRKLLLRDVAANLPSQTDTSCGKLRISFPRSFVAVGVFQIPFIFLFACCTGSAFAIVAFLPRASVEIVFAIIAAASFLGQCGVVHRLLSRYRTPLAHALLQFQKRLAELHPHPKSSAAGPGRSISMNQLLEFFNHFQGYICERNMYYVCHNMLLPMTRPKKLSYAELAGPSTLQWFVSHYWGTPFRHFVQSLRKHAETSGMASDEWQARRDWEV